MSGSKMTVSFKIFWVPYSWLFYLVSDSKEDVFAAYESSAYNCYITAGIYAAVVAFSGWQVMVNSKLSEYENWKP